MITFVAIAGAFATVCAAAMVLWAKNRRLRQELSEERVQRYFDWIVARSPLDRGPTPEERRRNLYVIKGGLSAAAVLAGRQAVRRWAYHAHPAAMAIAFTTTAALTTAYLLSPQPTHQHALRPIASAPRTVQPYPGPSANRTRRRRTDSPADPPSDLAEPSMRVLTGDPAAPRTLHTSQTAGISVPPLPLSSVSGPPRSSRSPWGGAPAAPEVTVSPPDCLNAGLSAVAVAVCLGEAS